MAGGGAGAPAHGLPRARGNTGLATISLIDTGGRSRRRSGWSTWLCWFCCNLLRACWGSRWPNKPKGSRSAGTPAYTQSAATSCSMESCLSVQCPPGRFSMITRTPNLFTLLFFTFSPTLLAHTREGRHNRVAKASANMRFERPDLAPGVESSSQFVPLFPAADPNTPLLWVQHDGTLKDLQPQSLALVSTFLVTPGPFPSPTPATGTEKGPSSRSLPSWPGKYWPPWPPSPSPPTPWLAPCPHRSRRQLIR